jgi:glucosamine--fructose-6-phosphate aminotransferase (isomerizing)
MCGISAYIGKKPCREFVLEGLSRLEYRGYDSAGFVCVDSKHGRLAFSKAKGRLSCLKEKLAKNPHDGCVGMGHTRWATHGIADERNAHPHFDCTKSIAVVHNGIIESYDLLRKQLIDQGHEFHSTTDTETVAHLLEHHIDLCGDIKSAILAMISQLHGAFAFVFLIEKNSDQLIVVRRRSPIAIGVGNGEMFVGSDPLVFSDRTNKVLFVPDNSVAIVKTDSLELFDFFGKELNQNFQKVDAHFVHIGKSGFEHYMLKEIYEQKQAIDRTIRFYRSIDDQWNQVGITPTQVQKLQSIHIVAAGTSWHAGRIAQFFFENVCGIPARVYLASEFRYMTLFNEQNTLYIFISQSGETADTLEALRLVNSRNIPTVVLTNVASSTMVREAGGFLLMQAGPEIAVASTKAFSTQIASLYWLSHSIAFEKNILNKSQLSASEEDLFVTAEILESTIESYKSEIIRDLAPRYAKYDRFIFLGRHISYPFALEAALKLKEISYIFAQCYPSGELKHGPIALIDDKTPVVLFSVLDDVVYPKIVSNAQEVKARNGHLVVFAFEGQDDLIELADYAFIIPRVKPLLAPLAMTGLMQFFVYHITKHLGLPIDKPRNLAKSVTVE